RGVPHRGLPCPRRRGPGCTAGQEPAQPGRGQRGGRRIRGARPPRPAGIALAGAGISRPALAPGGTQRHRALRARPAAVDRLAAAGLLRPAAGTDAGPGSGAARPPPPCPQPACGPGDPGPGRVLEPSLPGAPPRAGSPLPAPRLAREPLARGSPVPTPAVNPGSLPRTHRRGLAVLRWRCYCPSGLHRPNPTASRVLLASMNAGGGHHALRDSFDEVLQRVDPARDTIE